MPVPDDLETKFAALLTLIRAKVREIKAAGTPPADTLMYRRMKTLEVGIGKTGVYQRKATEEFIPKRWWAKASNAAFDRIQNSSEYVAFKSAFDAATAGGPGIAFDYAIQVVIGREFDDEPTELRHLELLLLSARGGPVPAWLEIYVFGLGLKSKAIELTLGESRVILRQVEIADYEKEHPVSMPPPSDLLHSNPHAVLRAELDVTSSFTISDIEHRLLTLLRLIHVWPVSFGQRTQGARSPFPFVGRLMLDGTSIDGGLKSVFPPNTLLTQTSAAALQAFFTGVGPNLDVLIGPNADTALRIAFERYSEAVFSYPLERRIAACIMGMEALFFTKSEMQELGYRLGLRVAKPLSKAGFEAETVRDQVHRSYSVRSRYVHGSYLSNESQKDFEKDLGLGLDAVAQLLLDYLRIAIAHLIVSKQSKSQFLAMIESSFLDQKKDAELGALIGSHRALLRPDLALVPAPGET